MARLVRLRPGKRVTRQAGNSGLGEWESWGFSGSLDPPPTSVALFSTTRTQPSQRPPVCARRPPFATFSPLPDSDRIRVGKNVTNSGGRQFHPKLCLRSLIPENFQVCTDFAPLPALRLISLSLSAASARPLFQAPQHGAPSRTPGRPSPTYIQTIHLAYLPDQPPYGPGPTLRCLPAARLHPPTPAAANDDIPLRNNRNTPDDPFPVPGPPQPPFAVDPDAVFHHHPAEKTIIIPPPPPPPPTQPDLT